MSANCDTDPTSPPSRIRPRIIRLIFATSSASVASAFGCGVTTGAGACRSAVPVKAMPNRISVIGRSPGKYIATHTASSRTAVLGAILLTAYFGGAVATHARVGSPLLSHTLFGVYLGVMAWVGLWLRDPRIRALLPIT